MQTKQYIQVILPLKLEWNPWYVTEQPVHPGQRIEVLLSGKSYIGVVEGIYDMPNIEPDKVLPVSNAQTGLPDISPEELRLWSFLSEYYLCTLGEVYKCAYPSQKLKTELIGAKKDQLATQSAQASNSPAIKEGDNLPLLLVGWNRIPEYINAIRDCIDDGKCALVLAAEMELALSLYEFLSIEFPDSAVCTTQMHTQTAQRKLLCMARSGQPRVFIGTRSSLFLPLNNLGLIIVDEEQLPSFKQNDPAPRYNTRDVALVLSSIHNCRIILGSSCPSLESYYNARVGKFVYRRIDAKRISSIELLDTSAEKRKNAVVGDFCTKALDRIRQVLGEDAQAQITIVKAAWQQEEELLVQLAELFPGLDPQIISPFSARNNLHKSKLTIIMSADGFFPREDFRADEKSYQLLVQLCAKTERMVIQSAKADHPMLKALSMDKDFTAQLLSDRMLLAGEDFPPLSRLVYIKDKKGNLVRSFQLKKDSTLVREKQRLKMCYGKDYIIDVDPL